AGVELVSLDALAGPVVDVPCRTGEVDVKSAEYFFHVTRAVYARDEIVAAEFVRRAEIFLRYLYYAFLREPSVSYFVVGCPGGTLAAGLNCALVGNRDVC